MRLSRYLIFKQYPHVGALAVFSEVDQKKKTAIGNFFVLFIFVLPILCVALLLGSAVMAVGVAQQAYETASIDPDLFADKGERSSFIYDRSGNLLYEIHSDKRRYYANLSDISQHVIDAVIAAEDKNFYKHSGADLTAIARSAVVNIVEQEVATGASTISQQVVRYVYFTENGTKRPEITPERKIEEIALALKLEKQFSKDEILEFYLNNIFLGNGIWGVETAAQVYFGKSAKKLTLAESSAIIGIIAEPTRANPYSNTYVQTDDVILQEQAKIVDGQAVVPYYKARQAYVLERMREEQMINLQQEAKAKRKKIKFKPLREKIKRPHFVWYVEQYLIEQYGPDLVYKGGLHITTTLHPQLQDEAERLVREHVDTYRYAYNMSNAALVSIEPGSGQILTMVGGYDYYDTNHDGNVNVITSYRQTGSSFKPIIYAAALEQGYGVGTRISDTKTTFYDGYNSYSPQNFDLRQHGSVSLRQALANSYNIPVVKLLNEIGVEPGVDLAKRLGIESLGEPYQYGLSFALGTAEIQPLELATAYCVFANEGRLVRPSPILLITDDFGKVIEDNSSPDSEQVLDARIAYMISDILSDSRARTPAFGTRNYLNLTHKAAAKTGTTSDFRDNWTAGYVPGLVTVVWAGNNSGEPLYYSYGSSGAAPLWNRYMERAMSLLGLGDEWYTKPLGISYYGDLFLEGNLYPNKYIK